MSDLSEEERDFSSEQETVKFLKKHRPPKLLTLGTNYINHLRAVFDYRAWFSWESKPTEIVLPPVTTEVNNQPPIQEVYKVKINRNNSDSVMGDTLDDFINGYMFDGVTVKYVPEQKIFEVLFPDGVTDNMFVTFIKTPSDKELTRRTTLVNYNTISLGDLPISLLKETSIDTYIPPIDMPEEVIVPPPDVFAKYFIVPANNNVISINPVHISDENVLIKEVTYSNSSSKKTYVINRGSEPILISYNTHNYNPSYLKPLSYEPIELLKNDSIIQISPVDNVITTIPNEVFMRYIPTYDPDSVIGYVDGVFEEFNKSQNFRYRREIQGYEYIGMGSPIITEIINVNIPNDISKKQVTLDTISLPTSKFTPSNNSERYNTVAFNLMSYFTFSIFHQTKIKRCFVLRSNQNMDFKEFFKNTYSDELRDTFLQSGAKELLLFINHQFSEDIDVDSSINGNSHFDINLDDVLGNLPDDFTINIVVEKLSRRQMHLVGVDSIDGVPLIKLTSSKPVNINMYGLSENSIYDWGSGYLHSQYVWISSGGDFTPINTVNLRFLVGRTVIHVEFSGDEVSLQNLAFNRGTASSHTLDIVDNAEDTIQNYINSLKVENRFYKFISLDKVRIPRNKPIGLGRDALYLETNRTDNKVRFINE